MVNNSESLLLNDGNEMPVIGLGVWKLADGHEVINAVTSALDNGYRLIDTAKIYRNEHGVGEAVRNYKKLPREEIFITTKLWNGDQGYETALEAHQNSLEQLGLGYVDLYLIHWPATELRHESWEALEQIQKTGGAKSIGVSNYSVENLKELMKRSKTIPAVNQIEFNPFVYVEEKPILEFCKAHSIAVEAYSPLAMGHRMNDPQITQIAQQYRKSNAQIMLRWALQHGTIPIPRSSNPGRIAENLDVFDFGLSSEEMESLNGLSH